MSWVSFAVLSYFFGALAQFLDKHLLSARIREPAVYAFLAGVSSLLAVALLPFGTLTWEWNRMGLSFIAGCFLLYSLLYFYRAVKVSEVSRVVPSVGIVVSVLAIVGGALPGQNISLGSSLPTLFGAFGLLIGGGVLLSFSDPRESWRELSTNILIAGVLLTVHLFFLKAAFDPNGDNFIVSFTVSRVGMCVAGMSLLFVPTFRKAIFSNVFKTTWRPTGHSFMTGLLFLANKGSGGLSGLLMSKALVLGTPALVQAVSGIQYAFLLGLAWLSSTRFPGVYEERFTTADWAQKLLGIIFVGVGIWLAHIAETPFI